MAAPASTTKRIAPTKATLNGGSAGKGTGRQIPRHIFPMAMGYLILLLAIFAVYSLSADVRDALPATLGVLPIGVPWFGAVGGALISLTATWEHHDDWKRSYDSWHVARPFIGMVVGSLGALILYVIANAATEDGTIALDGLTFSVVAFVVGYREATFRLLLKRITDLVIGPADRGGSQGG